MGIYIAGLEMPKDYSVIVKIFPDGRVGTIPYVQWFKVELIEGTQAVPVPPHGRLIDADALDSSATDYSGNHLVYLVDIDDAPTIIPADTAEERHEKESF